MAEPGRLFGEEVGAEGVPPAPLLAFPVLAPGPPRAPPKTARSVAAGWFHDPPGLRGLCASGDGSECDGWRHELAWRRRGV